MENFYVRKMDRADLSDVVGVEVAVYDSPWPQDIFFREITENKHAHYFVAVRDGYIIGYGGMWLVVDDAQITNIAIHPAWRGYKYGEALFRTMFDYGIYHGMRRLSLEVRESNVVAQRMYEKFGMVRAGIRKNYYTDNQEDAVVMWVNI